MSPIPNHERRCRNQRQSSTTYSSYPPNNLPPKNNIPAAPLDLSMHLPPKPLGNRFEVLRNLSPIYKASKDYQISRRYRRGSKSRETRGGKNRRGVRNAWKKQSVQQLDEQLSRDIDITLTGIAPFPQSVQIVSPPTGGWAIPSIKSSMPASTSDQVTQLPLLDLSALKVDTLFQAACSHPSPVPLVVPPPALALLSWCPALPPFVRHGPPPYEEPIFYDLSGLPERKVYEISEAPTCTELQSWHGPSRTKSRKQSRFFPSQPQSPRPKIKLPSLACRLHASDSESPESQMLQCADFDSGGTAREVNALPTTSDPTKGPIDSLHSGESSAANLWTILTSANQYTGVTSSDPYLASFRMAADEDPAMACYDRSHVSKDLVTTDPDIAELHNRALPYVHSNSLTGHANELALSLYAVEHPSIKDSGICITPFTELPYSCNELMMDHEYLDDLRSEEEETAPLPFYDVCPTYTLGDDLPVETAEEDGGAGTLRGSDAHFQSEQELFKMPATPAATPERSVIDIAAFLKLGHANNCWCGDCREEPLADEEEGANADLCDKVDDGWTSCSTTEYDESEWSIETHATAETSTRDVKSIGRCSDDWEWCETISGQPSPLYETVVVNSSAPSDDQSNYEWEFDVEF